MGSAPEMYASTTATIRLPERWQVADALLGDGAFPGDVRQRTDESTAVRTDERDGGRGESSNRSPAAAHDLTSPVAYNAGRESKHRSAGVIRQAAELFVAVPASRFEVVDREQSGLTCVRWKRSQRPDVVGDVIHPASGFDTGWPTVRATTDSMADERSVLRVAHALVAVELQTSRRGVNEFEH